MAIDEYCAPVAGRTVEVEPVFAEAIAIYALVVAIMIGFIF